MTFNPVQLLSHVQLFVIPWAVARQASLSFTILFKLMSIESVMPSSHLIFCCLLLLLPLIFPSIRVFSNELALHIRWPKYWSFSFSISPSNEYSGLISFKIDWFCCRKGAPPAWAPRVGFCLTLGKELFKETRADKARDFIEEGTWAESSRVSEPRRTALPHGSKSRVLW